MSDILKMDSKTLVDHEETVDTSPAEIQVSTEEQVPRHTRNVTRNDNVSNREPGIFLVENRHDETETNPSNVTPADRTQVFGIDENVERGNWTGRLDFLLAMLGYAVGLGNIWRFPYLCYRNGGGAFLIPYLLFMTVVGIPIFFLESCLGQFTSRGPTTCWEFAPLFKGVGLAMMVVSCITSLYYNMVISWCQFYFFASFTSTLPWSGCDNHWNTQDCSLKLPTVECTESTVFNQYPNGTCYDGGGKFLGIWNETLFTNVTGRKRISPSEEYWNNYALGISDGIDEMGSPRWQLALSLLLAWTLCFLCLIKGIKSTGKVVYFTATFPYVILLILFFRGVFLENAGEGIKFYILPKWEKLRDARVWRDAAVQIFYSMSPGWGGLIALSSYNRFHNNILRDSLIVSIANCMTSIFGGFVIFSYIGYMAGQLKVHVDEVAADGAGLAFVVYPEAIMNLPAPTVWSLLFFFMLITLGLDSQFTTIETILTGLLDFRPELRKWKTVACLVICIICFLLGLPLTTSGGMYMLQLLDYYAAGWPLLIIGLTEVTAITYIYGWRRYYCDIQVMLGNQPSYFWAGCWLILTPVCIVFILLFSWIDFTPVKYGNYSYPKWADGLGWLITITSILCIPLTMVYQIYMCKQGMTLLERIKHLLRPSRKWGPYLRKHRELIDYVDGFVLDPLGDERRQRAYINLGMETPLKEQMSNGNLSSVPSSQPAPDSTLLSQSQNTNYDSTV